MPAVSSFQRLLIATGLLASFAGLNLGFGIMGYEAAQNGVTYTTISWGFVAPVWLSAALFLLLGLFVSRLFFFPLLLSAAVAATYYGDVYGQFPSLVLIAASMASVVEGWRAEERLTLPIRTIR